MSFKIDFDEGVGTKGLKSEMEFLATMQNVTKCEPDRFSAAILVSAELQEFDSSQVIRNPGAHLRQPPQNS
jgi:hypothetical protein